jgi:beta-lactamase superfamily II metal-dependent hydrolase
MAKKKTGGSGTEISIRMYNVGFGDAFLVGLPTAKGLRRMLFDCGSIAAGPQSIDEVAKQIVADCANGGQAARIDVVIATHRHRDHVSGFALPIWNNVEVGEVWMPWTEDPTNPEARRIRDAQAGLCLALVGSLGQAGAGLTALAQDAEGPAARLDPLPELALNALSNEPAMNTLHSGFAGSANRRFLPEMDKDKKQLIRSFVTDTLPGVTIHVLGPSRSESVIREMDPPAGKSYLMLREEGARPAEAVERPFPEEYRWKGKGTPPSFAQDFRPEDREQVGLGIDLSDLEAAVALDKAVNGTSLMLVLEMRGKYLLFPGDAQWGTWNAALADPGWRDLLRRTVFYKVGHHGSHNATPVDFVEKTLGNDVVAMVSTLKRKIWPSIPRLPMLAALGKHARIARSDDEKGMDKKVFTIQHPGCIETRIPL